MQLIVHIVLLAATVLQCFEAKPAVVDWYLKKKDKESKPTNEAARSFRAKHGQNTHDREKEWANTVAEAEGKDVPKRKYGKKTSYTPAPTVVKPAKKEVEAKKPEAKKSEASKTAVVKKTQNQHKFDVKPVTKQQPHAKQQPVTTAAAHSATSLHNNQQPVVTAAAKYYAGKNSKSGSGDKVHQLHQSHKKAHAPGPAAGPAPAPAPAPLNYEQQVSKLKGDMMKKINGDSFDADLIIHRPTKTPPGNGNAEVPVPEFKDVGGDFGPYAPAAAPLKFDDISFKPGSLPVDAAHVNRETMTSDWHMEYGPDGPKGTHGARPQLGSQFQPLPAR